MNQTKKQEKEKGKYIVINYKYHKFHHNLNIIKMGHSSINVSLTYLRGLEVAELKEEHMPLINFD